MAAFGSGAGLALLPKLEAASVRIVEFDSAGHSTGTVTVEKVVKTDAEWRKQLNAEQFEVTRHEGTERAFSGKYAKGHDAGIYRCICCSTALFRFCSAASRFARFCWTICAKVAALAAIVAPPVGSSASAGSVSSPKMDFA